LLLQTISLISLVERNAFDLLVVFHLVKKLPYLQNLMVHYHI